MCLMFIHSKHVVFVLSCVSLVISQNQTEDILFIFGKPYQCVLSYECNNNTLTSNSDCTENCSLNNTICCALADIISTTTTTTTTATINNCIASNNEKCGWPKLKQKGTKNYAIVERIKNEENVDLGEFPWLIAIFNKNTGQFKCGASLIHPKAVITAAHCLDNAENYVFRSVIKYEKQETEAQTIVKHPKFLRRYHFNNIAFVVLKDEFCLGLICLPPSNTLFDDTNSFGIGWYKKPFINEDYQESLKKFQLRIINHQKCQTIMRNTSLDKYFLLKASFLCASGEYGKDLCLHNGGWPLVSFIPGQSVYQQVGIASYAIDCENPNVPEVYINVTNFRDWIDTEMTKYNLDKSVYQF